MEHQSAIDPERTKRLIAMGEMAASLAHEIRNPLGSMELFCSLLKKDLGTQPELLYLAEQIHKGIRTLDRVIANSLQFVRNSAPQRKRVESAKALVQELVEDVLPRADSLGITVQIDAPSDGEVNVDSFQMRQALLNIVTNAVEAVDERRKVDGQAAAGPDVQVTTAVEPNGDWKVSVADHGSGIRPEDESRIFDPFFTKKERGTGLGLSIVYSVVVAHGGSVDVETGSNGTKFVVAVPAQPAVQGEHSL